MEPAVNVKRLFKVPVHQWPVVNRGNAINRVQKILKTNHVTGIPSHWPKIYYGQVRSNLNVSRTYRNVNVRTLPDGAYLYLIEYNPDTNRYHKSFVQVLNKLESGSRHFQLPTREPGRTIVAAGELSKKNGVIQFNLESGTYTRNLMKITKNYMSESNYISLVKNAFRNSSPQYTTNILVPSVPASLKNLVSGRGNVSFYWNATTNKSKAKVEANLKKAGITINSAKNLINQLIKRGNSGSPPAKTLKRKSVQNQNVPTRRGRSAAR
jgi:hypothetical protein